MSRVKHIIMLALKVVYIVLCFVMATVFTALGNMDTSVLDGMKARLNADNCEIKVMDAGFEENGASLTYEIKDGRIVFDLVQGGSNYDDVCVLIDYPDFNYDAGPMREYLQENLGKKAEKEEEYLQAMENGPWRVTYSHLLTGDTEAIGLNNEGYTILTSDDMEQTEVLSAEGDEVNKLEDIYIGKGETLSFMLIFGTERYGALASGQYVFDTEVSMNGLYEGNAKLSFASSMSIITKTVLTALKEQGLGMFKVENWLTFYGTMIVTGMLLYLWRDLRSLKKIFGAMLESHSPPVKVIVKEYVNGFVTDEYSYIDDGTSMIAAFVVTLISYIFFLITYPIRILIHVIRDIIYLFVEDYDIEGFSLIGNILGSVGVYVLLFGIVSLLGASYLAGGIGTAIGIGMCIGAHFICKRCEEDYG